MRNTNQKFTNKIKHRRRLLPIAVLCLIAAFLLCGCSLGQGLSGNTILENVTVAGVDVGGMTKREAKDAIKEAVADRYCTDSVVVQVAEHSVSLSPEMTGATLDINKAVALAYAYGRSDKLTENAVSKIQAATTGIVIDIIPCLNLNTVVIETELGKLMENFSSTVTQPSYIISGAEGMDKTIIVTMGTPGYALTVEDLSRQVFDAYNLGNFSLNVDAEPIEPDRLDVNKLYEETYIASANAVYDPEKNETIPHTLGYTIDINNAKSLLDAAEYGKNVSIPYLHVEPEITTEDMKAMLFRDVLATYTAKSGSVYGRDTNLALACKAVNGVVLAPGELFDYNKVLGERTAEKGYQYGATYVGNKTVSTIGGGICQVSSTVYYCALMADMEIVTRTNHTFLNSYVPMGMDATVNWGGPDFRFRNNSNYPIRIEASAKAGHTTVTIYGTDDKDYYVKMEYNLLATYSPKTVEQEMPADNPEGYKDGDVITTSYTGYKVVSYRCKYDKKTDELISKVQESMNIYSSRDKVVCKIIKEETVPPTEDTLPEVTEPIPEQTEPNIDGPITEDN